MSNIHGLSFLAEPNRPLYERIFWLFALLAVCFGMVNTISAQINKYLSNPVLMSMNDKMIPVSAIPYPAITFCSSNQVHTSFANLTDLLERETLTDDEYNRMDIAFMLCGGYKLKYSNIIGSRVLNASFYKLYYEYGAKNCDRFIKTFQWAKMWNKKPCDAMQMVSTLAGMCYTFNMLPSDQLYTQEWLDDFQSIVGSNFTSYQYKYHSKDKIWDLENGYKSNTPTEQIPWRSDSLIQVIASFILDLNIDDMEEQCMTDGRGFMVAFHNPAEFPTVYQSLAYALTDRRTIIKIKPKMIMTADYLRSWLPEERGCFYSHERKLRFFTTYTLNNCNTECEINTTLEKCNCVLYFHTRLQRIPVCGLMTLQCYVNVLYESLNANSINSKCQCLPACTEITYEINHYSTPHKFEVYNLKDRMIPRNLASVHVSYTNKNVENLQRVGIITGAGFIASIGGLMGLFLGFSFISIFEAIYLFVVRWITNVWRNQRTFVFTP